jgi:hypothetical protein
LQQWSGRKDRLSQCSIETVERKKRIAYHSVLLQQWSGRKGLLITVFCCNSGAEGKVCLSQCSVETVERKKRIAYHSVLLKQWSRKKMIASVETVEQEENDCFC